MLNDVLVEIALSDITKRQNGCAVAGDYVAGYSA